jgi:sarcosine oxidase subunit alpha
MGFRVNSDTRRPQPITFTFEGVEIAAYPGETVAAALIAGNIRSFRRDLRGGFRGPYCNMGTCFECVLEVREGGAAAGALESDAGGPWRAVRACLTQVSSGLEARSRQSPGPEDPSK